jgi:hypothetical protein
MANLQTSSHKTPTNRCHPQSVVSGRLSCVHSLRKRFVMVDCARQYFAKPTIPPSDRIKKTVSDGGSKGGCADHIRYPIDRFCLI